MHFLQDGGDESETGFLVWEDGRDLRSSSDFSIASFDSVVGANPSPVCFGEGEVCECFRGIFVQPGGEFGGALS